MTRMRCRRCDQPAIINMRQHKLMLCNAHFVEWVPEMTEKHIRKFKMFARDDRILVAVSGGKDSLALWDILIRLGYRADGLYIGLGIDEGIRYSEESLQLTESFAKSRNLKLLVVDLIREYGATLPEIAQGNLRGRTKPCAVCGLSKRYIMNRVALEGGYDVLATGHNLDDEAAVLFGNTLNWLDGYLLRQGPVLEATHEGLVRKVKPLTRFYEREMAAYALIEDIEYIYQECPFAEGAKSIKYKEILNQLEAESPGAKQYFYLNFLKAKERGLFTKAKDEKYDTLHPCPSCGQPTSSTGKCSFCKLITNACIHQRRS